MISILLIQRRTRNLQNLNSPPRWMPHEIAKLNTGLFLTHFIDHRQVYVWLKHFMICEHKGCVGATGERWRRLSCFGTRRLEWLRCNSTGPCDKCEKYYVFKVRPRALATVQSSLNAFHSLGTCTNIFIPQLNFMFVGLGRAW